MPGYADRAVDSVFRRLGVAADFVPATGDALPGVLVQIRQADVGAGLYGVDTVSAGTVVDVRASEVAAPKKGDAFVIGGAIYTINAAPRREDIHRLVWTCQAVLGD